MYIQRRCVADAYRRRRCYGHRSKMQKERKPRAIGEKFGLLTIIDEVEPYRWRGRVHKRNWLCECDCGSQTICRDDVLASGHTRSCGCEKIRMSVESHTVHGNRAKCRKTYEYEFWLELKSQHRSGNLVIPSSWNQQNGFLDFIADVGYRPDESCRLRCQEGRSSRVASNWRWVPAAPRRGVSRLRAVYKGKEITFRELERLTGIKYETLLKRQQRGRLFSDLSTNNEKSTPMKIINCKTGQ